MFVHLNIDKTPGFLDSTFFIDKTSGSLDSHFFLANRSLSIFCFHMFL